MLFFGQYIQVQQPEEHIGDHNMPLLISKYFTLFVPLFWKIVLIVLLMQLCFAQKDNFGARKTPIKEPKRSELTWNKSRNTESLL